VLLVAKSGATPEYAAYVNDLFFHQTAGRYAGSWSHPQPFWYYLPVVTLQWLPLSLAYIGAAPRWAGDVRARDARVLLPLAWSLLVVLFFSIPTGKREVYLMPVLPMVALALAPHLEAIVAARWLRATALVLALVAGVVLVGAGTWALLGHSPAAEEFLRRRELDGLGHVLWGMFVAIGAVFLLASAWFRARRGVHALLAGVTALWLVWSVCAYPLLNDSSSAAGIMHRAREMAGADAEIGLVAWKEQNLLMAEGPVRDFGFREHWDRQYVAAAHWLLEAPAQRRVFILDQAMDAAGACVDRSKAHAVGHANRRDWFLLEADAIVPGCTPQPRAATRAVDAGDDADP
jgi:4-amino-4-deoxy-L-arabinose transferase-like glycosyltransferase